MFHAVTQRMPFFIRRPLVLSYPRPIQHPDDDVDGRASKRRKSQGKAAEVGAGGGMDWIDEALAVGARGAGEGGDKEPTSAEELAARKREEVGSMTQTSYCRLFLLCVLFFQVPVVNGVSFLNAKDTRDRRFHFTGRRD